ncbi:unnamed protein product [Linum tenue]|uniref:Uncharacterized protein n=1 Tax=Linum tenue TaxID=586396 RepID=A0AAV0HCX6_9ROSI|nr:unnamed protein product [Linum tenue]
MPELGRRHYGAAEASRLPFERALLRSVEERRIGYLGIGSILIPGGNQRPIMPKLLDIIHPAAEILVDIAKSQDSEDIDKVKGLATNIKGKSLEEKKCLLSKCAQTTLNSNLIGGEKEFFATMVVNAVIAIGTDDRLNIIGIKKGFQEVFECGFCTKLTNAGIVYKVVHYCEEAAKKNEQ